VSDTVYECPGIYIAQAGVIYKDSCTTDFDPQDFTVGMAVGPSEGGGQSPPPITVKLGGGKF
jgi:hypothetical protein